MWITYLKYIRKPFLGLTPLQQFFVDQYDGKNTFPFFLYLYFLTYEKEILDRMEEAEKEAGNKEDNLKKAYAECVAAMHDRTLENTTYKLILQGLGLFLVVSLMVSASVVSTDKVLNMMGESSLLLRGFFYLTAFVAQWYIYGKKTPEVLKNLLYIGDEGWHFKRYRKLKISNGKLINSVGQPQYDKVLFSAWMVASLTLAVTLGMILLGTVQKAENNIFEKMPIINSIAQGFGGVEGFGWYLFATCIICNFALYVSASLKYFFEKSSKKEENKSSYFLYGFVLLCVLNVFGLAGTMMAQGKSTIDSIWDFDKTSSIQQIIPKIIFPYLIIIAALGRIRFNMDAMRNLSEILEEAWICRKDSWHKAKAYFLFQKAPVPQILPNDNPKDFKYTAKVFTLQRDSLRINPLTGSIILAGNMVGAAAICAGLRKGMYHLYGGRNNEDVQSALLILTIMTMIGGALMSLGSATSSVKVKTQVDKMNDAIEATSLPGLTF